MLSQGIATNPLYRISEWCQGQYAPRLFTYGLTGNPMAVSPRASVHSILLLHGSHTLLPGPLLLNVAPHFRQDRFVRGPLTGCGFLNFLLMGSKLLLRLVHRGAPKPPPLGWALFSWISWICPPIQRMKDLLLQRAPFSFGCPGKFIKQLQVIGKIYGNPSRALINAM